MTHPVLVLEWAVLLGLGSVAVTRCVRALPPFSSWVVRAIKPWACDICMTFWAVVVLAAVAWLLQAAAWQTLVLAGPCAWTIGFAVLRPLSAPTALPPPAMMLLPVDSGDEENEDAGR